MRDLLAGCARRRGGDRLAVTEAIDDAVASLFVRWGALEVQDTGHFRGLVVQAVYWKAAAQRRALRRLAEALGDDHPAPDGAPADHHAQERFAAAVEALAEFELGEYERAGSPPESTPTPWANAVKARHLIGLCGADPAVGAPAPTFEAVGEVLGVSSATANKWYWKALCWIHEHFPDVIPVLPERKKAGRKKAGAGDGGTA
jgi:hypothetical protein